MRRCALVLLFVLLLASLPAVSGGDSAVAGPVLGYLWDQAASGLRPIFGIPGSSVLGAPLNTGARLAWAEVSPRQNYALGVSSDLQRLILLDLRSDAPSSLDIGAAGSSTAGLNPERIVISSSGAWAGLYYSDSRLVQIFSGLPDAPALAGTTDLSSLPGVLTAIAISDQGGLVLAAVSQGETGSLFAISPGATPRFVGAVGRASALSFVDGSLDAVIADYGRNEIVMIRNVTGDAGRLVLAGPNDGISKPVAISAESNGQRVFAAVETGVVVLGAGGQPALLPCLCSPSGLYRLQGSSVFRLNEPSGNPLLLLDAGVGGPRVLFVASGGSAASPQPALDTPALRGRVR